MDLAFEAGRAPARPSHDVESTVYRVVQEALSNVMKHAKATSATVSVSENSDVIEIVVTDDGVGFAEPRADGFGLRGIRERVALVGGDLDVESEPSVGTTVRATIPVREAESESESKGWGGSSAAEAG